MSGKDKKEGLDFTDPLQLPRMVVNPFRNRIQFIVETLLLHGTATRLLVAAGVIALTATFFGLLGYLAAMGTEQAFAHPGESVWWAFLRLTDPGYLGDDEGAALRVVSTLLTVAGFLLFIGVLVSILTQGLNELIRKLEMGTTPVSAKNHVILLGWSNRMPGIVRNFMLSEQRVKRFLTRIGAKRLRLLMLVEEVTLEHTAELRTHLGADWNPRNITLRSGSPLRLDHLKRVDYFRASAIVLPARDRGEGFSATMSDNATIKTILSLSQSIRHREPDHVPPLMVAELYDARKISVALHSYSGEIEIVAGDEVITRMMAQMIRHSGISHVYRELLTHGTGNELFARDCPPELLGAEFWDLAEGLDAAVLIGVTRRAEERIEPVLNPPADYRLAQGDMLVFIARDWRDGVRALASGGAAGRQWASPDTVLERSTRADHRLLVLGWSRRVPALLAELESYTNQTFHVTIVSRYSIEERKSRIASYGSELKRTTVEEILSDYTVPDRLEIVDPAEFDTVLCLASDGTHSDQEADARTLVASAILDQLLEGKTRRPRLLLELLDELNAALIDTRECEYLLTPHVLSHMLVQVALRRELNSVYQELFNSSETEIFFRDFRRYDIAEGTEVAFRDLEAKARRHGEIAIGIAIAAEETAPHGGVYLNPDRARRWNLAAGDRIVVLKR